MITRWVTKFLVSPSPGLIPAQQPFRRFIDDKRPDRFSSSGYDSVVVVVDVQVQKFNKLIEGVQTGTNALLLLPLVASLDNVWYIRSGQRSLNELSLLVVGF